jgi:hypothetical protein
MEEARSKGKIEKDITKKRCLNRIFEFPQI